MLTREADGNISAEATAQSGTILPEAMRTENDFDARMSGLQLLYRRFDLDARQGGFPAHRVNTSTRSQPAARSASEIA